jgi:hypothetical protein
LSPIAPLADPGAAARKLLELANAADTVRDRRIYVEKINGRSCSR